MKKIVYQGKQVTLADREFLSSGGQADIYLHNGLVYKIYHSSIPTDLATKIKELMVLDQPNIIRPKGLVFDLNNNTAGYTMEYVDNAVGLPLLFTTSYITRNNIQLADTRVLINEMADTLSFIHQKNIIVVDYNELNLLVDKATYKKPYHIDVDSYSTPSSPATVIMPSVRDYATSSFSTLTDWYSFGVISFQLFTGIHPYKGKHPTLKTVEDRCKHHVSVFNKDVGTPPSVRDFASIPSNYLDWYKDMFEKGLRTPPPAMVSAPQMRTKKKYVSAVFNIEKLFTAEEPIKAVEWLYGSQVVLTENFIYVNGKKFDRHHKYSAVILSNEGVLHEVWFDDTGMYYRDILRTLDHKAESFRAGKWFAINGRLYTIYEGQMFELGIKSAITTPYIVHTQPIHEQSAQTFDGIVYANIFGKAYFYIPCATKVVNVYQQSVLDGKRIIDARYDKEQLSVIAAESDGTIKRWRMAVTGDGSMLIEAEDISMQETNTTVLSNGISITYDSVEDQIDIASVGQLNHKIIKDAGIPSGASLVSTGTTAHYFVDDSLYKFSMK